MAKIVNKPSHGKKIRLGGNNSATLPLLVGVSASLILLFSIAINYGEASPSTGRPIKGKHVVSRSYRSTSAQGENNNSNSNNNFNSTVGGGGNGDRMCSIDGSASPGCRKAGLDMKKITLELIRHDILKKLSLDENRLPNVSAQNFVFDPSYLSGFVDMQGDSPQRDDNYDDEHARTEKIIAFSKPG